MPGFIENGSSTQHALYAQDEFKPARWLILNAGSGTIGYEDFQRLTPRAAVIVMPSHSQSFKYLFGSAFRAPNAYELNSFYFGVPNLRPESIDTHEIVWERYTNDWLRTSVSAYWYHADGPDHAAPDPSTFLGSPTSTKGTCARRVWSSRRRCDIRGGVRALMSYALQQRRQTRTAARRSPTRRATC